MDRIIYKTPDFDGENFGFEIEDDGELQVVSPMEDGRYQSVISVQQILQGLKDAGVLDAEIRRLK